MKRATKERIIERVEELRIKGNDFCPANLAHDLGTTAKHITQNIRHMPGVTRKKKCAVSSYSYKNSVWGFEPVTL